GWDPKGPPVVTAVRAGLDDQGNVVAWDYVARDFTGRGVPPEAARAGNFLAAHLIGLAADSIDEPPNLQEAYTFPNKRRVGEVVPWPPEASPLRTGFLRAPSQPGTTFGAESFVDELAAALRVDPVEFRLRYLQDPRAIAVIQAAAQKAGWIRRPSPKKGVSPSGLATGRGIAYAPRGNTRLATIAEVEVNQATGQVHISRLVIAHDCGLIINPDGLRGTIEANLIQSTSWALKEEVQFDRSGVTSVDWATYPILRTPPGGADRDGRGGGIGRPDVGRPHRRDRSVVREEPVRQDESGLRPARPAVQQRRGRSASCPARGSHARPVEDGRRDEPHGPVPLHPGSVQADEEPGPPRRPHHQQRLAVRVQPPAELRAVYGDEARDHRPHPVGLARRPEVRHRLRADRHRQRRHRHDGAHGGGRP